LSFSLLSLIGAFEPKAPNTLHSEKIEAKVGKEIILTSDLQLMIATLSTSKKGEKSDTLKKTALDTLIERALMRQYLEKLGFSVSDREIEQKISSIRTSNGIANNDQFRQMLALQGMSFEQLRDQIRFQMENMQFVGIMRRQASQTIDEKDLRAYYQEHKKDFKNNVEVELQECVIPIGEGGKAAAEKAANEFRSNPKKFDQCKTNNSNIGTFQSGLLREDIEQEVFKLNRGQVAIIEQPAGLQLLKVLDKKDLGARSFESVKGKIRESLESTVVQKEIQRTMSDLRTSTYIQI